MRITVFKYLAFVHEYSQSHKIFWMISQDQISKMALVRWLFHHLLLFLRLSLCLLCVSHLLHARFFLFFIHLSSIHFTSQLSYPTHPKKARSYELTILTTECTKIWTQATISNLYFSSSSNKKEIENNLTTIEPQKRRFKICRYRKILSLSAFDESSSSVGLEKFHSTLIELNAYSDINHMSLEIFGLSECKILTSIAANYLYVYVYVSYVYVVLVNEQTSQMPIKLLNVSFSILLKSAFLQNNVSCFFIRYNFYC